MVKAVTCGLFILRVVMIGFFGKANGEKQKVMVYPKTRVDFQKDVYHGIEVKDPYRHLEETDSEETKEWVLAQNLLTFHYLNAIPEKEAIRKRLESLWNYERYGLISKKSNRYFFTKNDGLQNQYVLYTLKELGGTPEVLSRLCTFFK